MYNVYITDHVTGDITPEREALAGAKVELLNAKDWREVAEAAKDADALMNTYMPNVCGELMDALPNLRVIVRYGIGVNTIDVPAARKRGIQVANVPDYCLDEVSDHAVALLLTLVRKTALSDARIKRDADYSLSYVAPIRPLRGMNVTIVGFGRIGRKIAAKLAPFGCVISYADPYLNGDIQFEGGTARSVTLESAYENADAIILQAPATAENYHMLDADAFNKMRRAPYIVNTARGELIDTLALSDALSRGLVAGAGLDVIEGAPPIAKDNPLLSFENAVLTPHSAWVSENSFISLQRLAALEVARALAGEEVKSPVYK